MISPPETIRHICRGFHSLAIVGIAVVISACPLSVFAKETKAVDVAVGHGKQTGVVLLIEVGDNATARDMERRFASELSLNAESFRVEKAPAGVDGFLQLPLDLQIERISSTIEQKQAMAAMWLNAVSEDHLLLQVVVLEVGRSLVRLFKQKRDGSAVNALAVTAAGLLETTFASGSMTQKTWKRANDTDSSGLSPPQRNDAPRPLVAPIGGRQNAVKRAPAERPWHLALSVIQTGPITGSRGPALGVGGSLDAARAISKGVNIDGGLGGAFQPFNEKHTPIRGGWRIWLEIHVSRLFTAGIVKVGPLLGLDGGINGTIVEDAPYPRRRMTFWNLRGQFGATIRVAVLQRRWISFGCGVAADPTVAAIRRESNGEILGRTPVLGWWLRLEMGLL